MGRPWRDLLILAGWEDGQPLGEIAARYEISEATVYRIAAGYGASPRSRGLSRSARSSVAEAVADTALRIADIAAAHEMSPETVRVISRAAGLAPRPRGRRKRLGSPSPGQLTEQVLRGRAGWR